jgi:hypothetical protein
MFPRNTRIYCVKHRLVVNHADADKVREIFKQYAELVTVRKLREYHELQEACTLFGFFARLKAFPITIRFIPTDVEITSGSVYISLAADSCMVLNGSLRMRTDCELSLAVQSADAMP